MQTATKAKTTGSGMILTDRDRRAIEGVNTFGIATREHIARLLKFGSVTRANAVLLRLARHRYLARRLQPSLRGTRRLTYFLGPLGAELLGLPPERGSLTRRWSTLSDLFVEHQLSVNDVRLAFERLGHPGYESVRWVNDRTLARMNLRLVPDGYCEYLLDGNSYSLFVEVDRGTESRRRWTQKVNGYVQMAFGGEFATKFSRKFFRVIVTTPSARRLTGIKNEIAKRTDKIFWLAVHDDLLRLGPFAQIWQRPTGNDSHSLTNQ